MIMIQCIFWGAMCLFIISTFVLHFGRWKRDGMAICYYRIDVNLVLTSFINSCCDIELFFTDMATKALRIPTPKESLKEHLVMNLSQNNNNAVTKETNQAKDNSIIEDVCRDKVKGRSSNAQNLVERNTNSEVSWIL